MRITFVVPAFPQGSTDGDFWEYGLCQIHQARALAERGHAVSVVARSGSDRHTQRDEVSYHFVSDAKPATLKSYNTSGAVIRQVQATAPDIVHFHGFTNPVLLSHLGHALGGQVPVFAEYHGETSTRFPVALLTRHCLRRIAGLVFANPARAEQWRTALSLPPSRIFQVVECAPDRAMASRAEARARTGMQGEPVILWNSRAIKRRNPVMVVEAYDAFLRETPQAKCHFYMMIPDHDAGVPERIEQLCAHSPRLQAQFTLVLGRRSQAAMTDYYNSADYILSGSQDDPYGYGVADAMCCGVIPIVPRSATFLDITQNGRVGLLWDVQRPQTLVEALQAMPTDPSQIAQMAVQVRSLFLDRLSMAAQAKGLEQAYDTALRKHEKPAHSE